MKKFKVATTALALIVIAVISSIITTQVGSVSDLYAYKSCVDDSECGDDGYCDNGKCIKSEELKSCVNDSECGDDEYCDDGNCIKTKEKKGCVDDSDCDEGGYCVDGECQQTKQW